MTDAVQTYRTEYLRDASVCQYKNLEYSPPSCGEGMRYVTHTRISDQLFVTRRHGRSVTTRRRLLSGLGVAAATSLTGCVGAGGGGSDTVDCQTRALAHGDGDVLDGGAMATTEGGDVRLAVPLSVDRVRNRGVERLLLYDADGDLAHAVPVSADDADVMAEKSVPEGRLRYEQYLGRRPLHGQYEIVAVNPDGTRLDSVTVEFNCFTDVDG